MTDKNDLQLVPGTSGPSTVEASASPSIDGCAVSDAMGRIRRRLEERPS